MHVETVPASSVQSGDLIVGTIDPTDSETVVWSPTIGPARLAMAEADPHEEGSLLLYGGAPTPFLRLNRTDLVLIVRARPPIRYILSDGTETDLTHAVEAVADDGAAYVQSGTSFRIQVGPHPGALLPHLHDPEVLSSGGYGPLEGSQAQVLGRTYSAAGLLAQLAADRRSTRQAERQLAVRQAEAERIDRIVGNL